jgi:hypothetical protein
MIQPMLRHGDHEVIFGILERELESRSNDESRDEEEAVK